MRRLLCAAAALGLIICAPGWAWADNQETAQQIANNLRTSGKMKGYSVAVKVEDGTAWLNGTVANQEQMVAALSIAQQTDGIDRVVNNLTIAAPHAAKSASGLRQPGLTAQASADERGAASGQKSARRNGVVQAGMMDIPDHAKSDLMVAGPPTQMDEPRRWRSRVNRVAPMPLPFSPSNRPQYSPVAMQQRGPMGPMNGAAGGPAGPGGPGEMIGTPKPMPAYVPTGPAPLLRITTIIRRCRATPGRAMPRIRTTPP